MNGAETLAAIRERVARNDMRAWLAIEDRRTLLALLDAEAARHREVVAALREVAMHVEPLLRARHEQAHNGDIVRLGSFETCDLCGPLLAEARRVLQEAP